MGLVGFGLGQPDFSSVHDYFANKPNCLIPSHIPKQDNTRSVGMAGNKMSPGTKRGPTWHYKHPARMQSFASLQQSSGASHLPPSPALGTLVIPSQEPCWDFQLRHK